MDFSLRAPRQYSQKQFITSGPTESQIITTLNSSIEDLLSKISKVTEDYAISSSSFRHSSQKTPARILGEHKFQLNHSESRGIKTNYSKYYEPSSLHSTSPNQQQSLQNRQNQKFKYYYPSLNTLGSVTGWKISHPTIMKANTLNRNDQEITLQDNSLKLNKLGSLFDHSNVKEVDASTILVQSTDEGTFDRLEVSVRQVQEVTIYQEQNSNKETQIKSSISLADFQIGNSIGSGKFGEVYACRHKKTGFLFALKKIFKSTIKEYRMEAQFCLQLKILYMLNHPNIIKLYGHFNDEYHIFLLMEYVQGGQLLSKLKSEERYVARILDQIISAVDYIHERGIVHRDIKPQNIVLSFQSSAKLCDFGWAGIFDQKNMKTTFCGTLDYVSPEMKDKGAYGSTVDLWSIGVLAFQLLVGYAPFKDEINAWKKKGSKRSVQWDWHINYPSEVSGLGQSFMRNLLKENPGQRASLKFCKNHFFIRKHKQLQSQINIQMYI